MKPAAGKPKDTARQPFSPVRLPLARARFYFLPNYSPTGRAWQNAFEKLVRHFAGDEAVVRFSEVDADTAEVRLVGLERLYLSVDAGNGEISIDFTDEDQGFGIFWNEDFDGRAAKFFSHDLAEAQRLAGLARDLWVSMGGALEAAIEAGDVQLEAHQGSLLGPKTIINPSHARFFTFEAEDRDVDTGEAFPAKAVAVTGETLFDPHVIPPAPPSHPKGNEEIAAWIIATVPTRPELAKRGLFDAAKILWPGLTLNRFNSKVWPLAAEKAPALELDKAGRKKKKSIN